MDQSEKILAVEIKVLSSEEPLPIRNVMLKSPTFAIRIGRGSRSGNNNLGPASDNAWFDARVMSREHAILKANPDTDAVYLEDVGSMHGTAVADQPLIPHQRRRISLKETINFGRAITRGQSSFMPLQISIAASWMRQDPPDLPEAPKPINGGRPTNTFQVPDIDDEDAEDGKEEEEEEDEEKEEEEGEEDEEVTFMHEAKVGATFEVNPSPVPFQQEMILPSVGEAVSQDSRDSIVDLKPLGRFAPVSGHPDSANRMPDQVVPGEGQLHLRSHPGGSQQVLDPFAPTPNSFSTRVHDQMRVSPPGDGNRSQTMVAGRKSDKLLTGDEDCLLPEGTATRTESSPPRSLSPPPMVDYSQDEPAQHAPRMDCADGGDATIRPACESSTNMEHRAACSESGSESSRLDDDLSSYGQEGALEPVEGHSRFNASADGGERVAESQPASRTASARTKSSLPSLNRAPSPSDAAMMKSWDFPSTSPGTQPGPYQDSCANPHAWPSPIHLYTPGFSYCADNQSSMLYHAHKERLEPRCNGKVSSPQYYLDNFAVCSDSSVAIPCHSGALSVSNGPHQTSHGTESIEARQHDMTSTPITDSMGSTLKERATADEERGTSSTAKVSINSIVDSPARLTTAKSRSASRLKRKVDEREETGTGEVADAAQEKVSTSSFPSSEATGARAARTDGHAIDDRPAKRARTSVEQSGRGFVTLAATALAGAVVGGVGVVAALVSLPADFFV